MPTSLDMQVQVDAPRSEVFDLMADAQNERDWNPDVIEIERVGDGPLAPGAEWRARHKGMGAVRIRLDEYERPTRLAFSGTSDRMDMRFGFTFSGNGAGTQLHAVSELHPKGAMRLAGPLFAPMMKRTFAKRPAQLTAGVAAFRAKQHS